MTRRRRASRGARGATLIEIMITMAVVLIGMLGLFKVVTSSSQAGASAQHFLQARARAQQVMEAIRGAPKAALDCLATTAPTGWSACEALCRNAMTPPLPAPTCPPPLGQQSAPPSCVFTTLSCLRLDQDNTRQPYAVVEDDLNPLRTTFVQRGGVSNNRYVIMVSIGWNDDGVTVGPLATAGPPAFPDHRVTLQSAVFP